MIAAWMLYGTVLAAFFSLAARLIETVLAARGSPTRWVWVGAMVGSVAIPGLALITPATSTAVALPEFVRPFAASAVTPVTASTSSSGFDAVRLLNPINGPLTTAWIVASVVILAVLAWTSWLTKRQATAWQPARVAGIDVMYSAASGPAVIGWFPGKIVLPRWTRWLDADWQSMMVLHELEHVRARDTALFLGGLALAALIPWNAVVWWQFKRLKQAVELDCDRRVLQRGVNRQRYGELLIELTQRGHREALRAAAFSSHKPFLSRRIAMMAFTKRPHGLRTALGIATAAALIAIGCAMPTPPEGGDTADWSSGSSPVPLDELTVVSTELAEAHEGLTRQQELPEHTAANATASESLNVHERRFRLARAVLEAQELAEMLKHKREPVVYVDGVRVSSDQVWTGGTEYVGFSFRGTLDPDQVERIEIIKGAAAERLYSADAAAGAILITTKAGTTGTPRR